MPSDEQKPKIEAKSSMEILSELFSTFDADPPVIVKKEKDESSKKHKKSKKKHKHKDKKHKKKSKKRKRNSSESSSSSGTSAIDLSDILIKTEKSDSGSSFLTETLKKIIDLESLIKSEEGEVKEEKCKIKKVCQVDKKPVHKRKKQREISDDEVQPKKKKHKHELPEEEVERKRRKCKHDVSDEDVENKKKKNKHEWADDDQRSKPHKEKSKKERDVTPERDKHDYRSKDSRKDSRHKPLDLRDRIEMKHRDDHKYRNEYKYKEDYKSKDDYKYKDYKGRDYEEDKRHKHRDNPFYRGRSEDRHPKDDKWDKLRDKYRGHDTRDRDKFRDSDSDNHIDKKKLLEIARRNAIQMMKSGSLPGALTLGPQAQEKVIAAIRSGGKTVEELTDFCKTLSKKEELGELSSVSEDNGSDSDGDQPFHHPFQIKDKPLTINIKNSVPLPIKTNQERASELRIQFPVSSGQQHRKTEGDWIPVLPKKVEPPPVPKPVAAPVPPPVVIPVPVPPPPVIPVTVPAPVNAPPGPQVFPVHTEPDKKQENIDIASIVSQRLTAMRKLQENPNDVQAITQMYKAQKEMNTWAESKQQIGQFTGSTGAQILSQAELSSGYQAWARKDQLQTAAPVTGGMGMHLLQKMGWKPGEGLGKEKTGALEPLLLEVKLDKKGIVAKEEQKKKAPKVQKQTVKTLQGKHPVSLLGEYSSKRKLGAPQYIIDFECGPDHKKNFLFKVVLNGIEYKPNIASGNKKEAKAMSATVCLQQLGLLPS